MIVLAIRGCVSNAGAQTSLDTPIGETPKDSETMMGQRREPDHGVIWLFVF
jgi:hypothetical protein